jgi:hypothetical protein
MGVATEQTPAGALDPCVLKSVQDEFQEVFQPVAGCPPARPGLKNLKHAGKKTQAQILCQVYYSMHSGSKNARRQCDDDEPSPKKARKLPPGKLPKSTMSVSV